MKRSPNAMLMDETGEVEGLKHQLVIDLAHAVNGDGALK